MSVSIHRIAMVARLTVVSLVALAGLEPGFGETVYYSRTGNVHRTDLNAAITDTFARNGWNSTLHVDPRSSRVYWALSLGTTKVIRSADANGGMVRDVTSWDGVPGAIAVDNDQSRIYWTDPSFDRIRSADLNTGSAFSVIASRNDPTGLALNSSTSKLYWTDREESGGVTWRIQRADTGGTNIETIVSGLIGASAIVVDEANAHLYWISDGAIQRADLDGANVVNILGAPGATYLLLDAVEGMLYWNDAAGIQRVGVDGVGIELVLAETSLTGLALDPSSGDCNRNGTADAVDIAAGTSEDCNGNLVPDECDWRETDCNGTGVPDACELATGSSFDCNGNARPDECDVSQSVGLNTAETRIVPPPGFEAREFANGFSNLKTSVAISEGGAFGEYLYVAGSTGIDRVNPSGVVLPFSIVTNVRDMAFSPASSPWSEGLYCVTGSGTVVQVFSDGSSATVATGLVDPRHITFGFDGKMFVLTYDPTELMTVDTNGSTAFFAGPFQQNGGHIGLAFGRLGDLGEFLIVVDGTVHRVDAGGSTASIDGGDGNVAFASDPFGNGLMRISCSNCDDEHNPVQWQIHGVDVSATGDGHSTLFLSTVDKLYDLAFGRGGTFSEDLYLTIGWRIVRIKPIRSYDCDASGVPDECESLPDCNTNDVPDDCDIFDGVSTDCNRNATPDECELDTCLTNGLSEICESESDNDPVCCVVNDCNGNGTLDLCDTFLGTSGDEDADGFPNECGKFYLTDAFIGRLVRANTNGSNVEVLRAIGPQTMALDSVNQTIYFESGYDIKRMNLDGSSIETIVSDTNALHPPMAVDLVEGRLYYIRGDAFLARSNLDGSNEEIVITSGKWEPEALAVDPIGGRVYWTDLFQGIWRANTDGSQIERIFYDPDRTPRYLVVDSCNEKIYWSARVVSNGILVGDGIWRANLDGTVVEEVERDCCGRKGLALDLMRGKLYSAYDGLVERRNLDGTGIEVITDLDQGEVFALDSRATDCNANGVFDECDVSAGLSLDCNLNGVPDECEPPQPDCNANGTADGCDIANGTSDDCDFNGVLDECQPTVAGVGSRYISIHPEDGLDPVALLIRGAKADPDVACVSVYVQSDGTLGDTPVFQTPSEWCTVHAHGLEIIADRNYDVSIDDGTIVSDLPSIQTSKWGDSAGLFVDGAWEPADGAVNITDALACVDAFGGVPTIPLQWCDLDPEIPNGQIDIIDILRIIEAFSGLPYPHAIPCK